MFAPVTAKNVKDVFFATQCRTQNNTPKNTSSIDSCQHEQQFQDCIFNSNIFSFINLVFINCS